MKEIKYKLDLTTTQKSKIRILFGMSMALISIFWIILSFYEGRPGMFDYVYAFLFFSGGIINIYEGSGKSISEIFGKRFIEINYENMKIKLNTFSNEEVYNWDELEELDIGSTSVGFKDKSGRENKFYLGDLEYKTVKQIKELIIKLADEKGLRIKE